MLDKILAALEYVSKTELFAAGSVVLEVALRLFKTEKPRSILLFVANLFSKLAKIFTALSSITDKVIPQHTKE